MARRGGEDSSASVVVTTSADALSPPLVAALFRPDSHDPDDVMVVAARAIVEAQGGDVSLADGTARGLLLRFQTDRRA
jgi:hypothetical protein